MLTLAVYIASFTLASSEHLLGVNYTFDVDFERNFDSKRCFGESMWRLVRYGTLDVTPPFEDSDRALKGTGKCCASSFPIIFVDGVLEVTVYAQATSEYFELSVEVFDEDGECVTSYVYGRSSGGFRPGWRKLSIKINKHVRGYIQLRGSNLRNEILLIDSFRYIPNETHFDHKRTKRKVTDVKDEADIMFIDKWRENLDFDTLESSGDDENETEPPVEEPNRIFMFWNPFTIVIISALSFVVLAVFGATAYHCGKIRATDNMPMPIDVVEPPRTIVIPRVGGATNRDSSRFYEY